ncbi:MAG: hypothetical protein LBF94_02570 [Puniceicoccales bacterium]|jgi:hypothetical protein|nr:hypothetical protein [Puniceicoccales bacterium]
MESAIAKIANRTSSDEEASKIDEVVSAVQMEKFCARASKCCEEATYCLDLTLSHSLEEKETALQNVQRAWQGKPLIKMKS